MSEIINLKKIPLVVTSLRNVRFFANTLVCTVLADLLTTFRPGCNPILLKIDIHVRYRMMLV